METIQDQFWKKQLEETAQILNHNGFDTCVVDTLEEATALAYEKIQQLAPETIGMGGSMTLEASGLLTLIRENRAWELLESHHPSTTPEAKEQFRRRALLSDLFLSGVNAVTKEGALLWLDMIGNRITPISYGPTNVLLFAGRNKLVADFDEGIQRIKKIAAPMNTLRLSKLKTPCQHTGVCHSCSSPDRICNSWLIMERCFPKGRIKLILINEDLGY